MTRKKKQNEEPPEGIMSLLESCEYLKKMGEHWTVNNMNRDTILLWADYLYNHEKQKKQNEQNILQKDEEI